MPDVRSIYTLHGEREGYLVVSICSEEEVKARLRERLPKEVP